MIRIPTDADIEALWAELEHEAEPQDCLDCEVLGAPCPDHDDEEDTNEKT